MKVVVAIDSMKGCLCSLGASEACAAGIGKCYPDAEIIVVPVADGGEGTAVSIAFANQNVKRLTATVNGPLNKEIEAEWWFDEQSKTAYIDMASAAGLTLVPIENRTPLYATTFGVGQLILESICRGADHVVLGLGGSATVDGGIGACQALGVGFIDAEGNLISHKIKGSDLSGISDIDISKIDERLKKVEVSLACDVTSPFTGESGAARVFGPQKGASPEEVEILEKGLENIRRIILKKYEIDLNAVSGSGAAGGCAGGLMALAAAKIEKGAQVVLYSIGFDRIIDGADLIVTGEGSADAQTLMGKLPYEILQRGKERGIPVWLVAGRIADENTLLSAGFDRLININSEENILRSRTEGKNDMEPEVAKARLFCCNPHDEMMAGGILSGSHCRRE